MMKPGQRRDLSVYNEATSFTLTSRRACGTYTFPLSAGQRRRGRAEGQFLCFELVQDDPINVRLVLGDELTAEERGEIVHRTDGRLDVTDGQLVVAGGAECLWERWEKQADYAQQIAVPPGVYRLEVAACFTGVNGPGLSWGNYGIDAGQPGATVARRRGGPLKSEPVGAWFRRTRRKERMPAWLRMHCYEDPRSDPGYEHEYDDDVIDYDAVENALKPLLDFVVRLTPLRGRGKPRRAAAGTSSGVVPTPRKFDLPAACPRGLLAKLRKPRIRQPAPPVDLPKWAASECENKSGVRWFHPQPTDARNDRRDESMDTRLLWQHGISGFSWGGTLIRHDEPEVEHYVSYRHGLGFWSGVYRQGEFQHWMFLAWFGDRSMIVTTGQRAARARSGVLLVSAPGSGLVDLAKQHVRRLRRLKESRGEPLLTTDDDAEFKPMADYVELVEELRRR
jgi:hypothetical protein